METLANMSTLASKILPSSSSEACLPFFFYNSRFIFYQSDFGIPYRNIHSDHRLCMHTHPEPQSPLEYTMKPVSKAIPWMRPLIIKETSKRQKQNTIPNNCTNAQTSLLHEAVVRHKIKKKVDITKQRGKLCLLVLPKNVLSTCSFLP